MKQMKKKFIPYGKGSLSFEMPVDSLPLKEITDFEKNNKRLTKKDVIKAIHSPEGTPGLHDIIQKKDKVILLVPDITRRAGMDKVLPPLVDELENTGVPYENITLLFANGLHDKQSDEQKISIIGEELFKRVPNIFDHDADDENNLVEIGNIPGIGPLEVNRRVLQADKIICTGSVRYHRIAGFSGGGKIILPGISSRKSILAMHSQDFKKGITKEYAGITDNPFFKGMQKAANLVNPHFFVNTVVEPNGEILDISAGSLEAVHKNCCESVKRIFSVKVKEKVPFVIVSAGGYPFDISWIQSVKALANWIRVLEDGGWMIIVGQCGEKSFASNQTEMIKYETVDQVEESLHKNFTMERYGLYRILLAASQKNIIPISDMSDALVRKRNLKIVNGRNAEEKLNNAIRMVEMDIGMKYNYYLVNQGGSFLPVFDF